MSSRENAKTNAAYIAYWQQLNPKLLALSTDGCILHYEQESLDISDIYMQDILRNANLYGSIPTIEAKDLFAIIKIYVITMKIKEEEHRQKLRRLEEYE